MHSSSPGLLSISGITGAPVKPVNQLGKGEASAVQRSYPGIYFYLIFIMQRFAVFTAGFDDREMKLPVHELTVREARFSQQIFTRKLEHVIIIAMIDSLSHIQFKKRDT